MSPELIVKTLLGESEFSDYENVAIANDMRAWATQTHNPGTSQEYLEWELPVSGKLISRINLTLYPRRGQANFSATSAVDAERIRISVHTHEDFAKLSADLYSIVARIKKLVETWMNGTGTEPDADAFINLVESWLTDYDWHTLYRSKQDDT